MCKSRIRVAIAGAGGRMGWHLIQSALQTDGVILGAALEQENSPLLGNDAGEIIGVGKIGVTIQSSLKAVKDDFDIFIDFTNPEVTLGHLKFCKQYGKAIIIGTTGFNNEIKQIIRKFSNDIAIVFSANFSTGFNVMLKLLEKAAKIIGNHTDIKVIEMHHNHKVDIPSGSALAINEVVTNAINKNLKEYVSYDQEEFTINKKKLGNIDLLTVRAGDIVGEHTVIFADIGERIEIIHRAYSRNIFANGAIKSAIWIKEKKAGLFDMKDVLNLNNI